MAVELVYHMVTLVVVRRFRGMGAGVLRTLVHCVLVLMSACNISIVDLLMFPFHGFWGMCGETSRNVFLLLFMVPIFAMLSMRALPMHWHVSMFLELRHVGVFPI
jgi:hypothetical protein